MSLFYHIHDFEFCDYELYQLPGVRPMLRGPRPPNLSNIDRMISFVGAAQTFGVMCRHPFPALLGSMLAREVLNLGIGGAGPRTFLAPASRRILEYVNKSQVCVVQVMSGRGEENGLLVNPGGGHKLRWRTDPADTPLRTSAHLYEEMIRKHDSARVLEIVEETRRNWIESYRALAAEIHVPKILLWISTRRPGYELSTSSVHGIFGGFPQMVNEDMLATISPWFDRVAEVTSKEGMPAPLWSRFTGLPIRVKRGAATVASNKYYPSPQMHMRAAQALEPLLREYLPTESTT